MHASLHVDKDIFLDKKINASPDVCSYKIIKLDIRFSAANGEYCTEIRVIQNQQELFQKVLIVPWMHVFKKI